MPGADAYMTMSNVPSLRGALKLGRTVAGRIPFVGEADSRRWIERYYGIGFSTVNAAIRREVWERHPFGRAPIMEDKKWQRDAVAAVGGGLDEAIRRGKEYARIGCDMLSATGRKFLRGPRGTGFLYVRPDRQQNVHPNIISHHLGQGIDTDRFVRPSDRFVPPSEHERGEAHRRTEPRDPGPRVGLPEGSQHLGARSPPPAQDLRLGQGAAQRLRQRQEAQHAS
mgnify:CR=1 FL=1